MSKLAGKVVIITGGGNGIGRESALLCAKEGAKVVVVDSGCERDGTGQNPTVVESVVDTIRKNGGEALGLCLSLGDNHVAETIVTESVGSFGGVDVLVNCAGIVRDSPFLKIDQASWNTVLNVHLTGMFELTQRAVRQMIDQKRGGKIVQFTGLAGILGNVGQTSVSTAMAAIYGFTRTTAIELKKHHINVNAIAPVARTRMTEDLPMFQALPQDAYGPQFVAPVVVFLASKLSDDLTGEIVSVAGTKISTFRMVESEGIMGENPVQPWTADEIASQWRVLSKMRR